MLPKDGFEGSAKSFYHPITLRMVGGLDKLADTKQGKAGLVYTAYIPQECLIVYTIIIIIIIIETLQHQT